MVESYRRIRNTLRFLLANLADFDPAVRCGGGGSNGWRSIATCWRSRAELQDELTRDYRRYEFHLACIGCIISVPRIWAVSTWIFSRIGFIPQQPRASHAARRKVRCTISRIAWCACLRLFSASPLKRYGSHLAGTWDNEDSVLLHTWHEFPLQPDEGALIQRWTRIRELRSLVQRRLEESRAPGENRFVACCRG